MSNNRRNVTRDRDMYYNKIINEDSVIKICENQRDSAASLKERREKKQPCVTRRLRLLRARRGIGRSAFLTIANDA